MQSESAIRLAQTGLPRRVLRHLIFSHDIGVGSRVLDVGCGTGDLVRFLDELGIKASGIASSEEELEQANASVAGLEFFGPDDCRRLCDQGRSFDLVVVRASAPHAINLFSQEAFARTAGLIEILRPAGNLVFVQQNGSCASGDRTAHASSCYSRHLCMFPGSCKTAEFPTSGHQIEMIRRMFVAQPSEHIVTATYSRPLESSTQYEWQAIARVAADSHRDRCCRGVAALHGHSRNRAA
jgi:SAM-dependent methyltransferase